MVFPCQENREVSQIIKESERSNSKGKSANNNLYIVVTEEIFLVLEPDHKIKNVAKLLAWATLPSIE